ncbi:MAG: hypothetical protein WDO14_01360 [Bacteroidota bacterium]
MNALQRVADAAERVVNSTEDLVPFGKAERITAGICMGIPFFLLVAGIDYASRSWWWFTVLAIFFLTLPFVITFLARSLKVKKENHGLYITLMFGGILTGLYLLFRKVFTIESQDSISAYVTIHDSFIFGALLSIAAMLFITNGLVYWDEHRKNIEVAGRGRGYINVILGVALQGVVLFPCNRLPGPHYFFAVTFFVGCAIATIIRSKGSKQQTKHKIMDYSIASIMVAGFILFFGKAFFNWSGWLVNWVDLFGAESVGLWVIGIDFILVSLKRLPDTETVPHAQVKAANEQLKIAPPTK